MVISTELASLFDLCADFVSTALAVLFTLVDSGIYIVYSSSSTIDSFDCYKLLKS